MKYVLTVYLPGLIIGALSFYLAIKTGLWPVTIGLWVLISGLGIATGFHRVYSHRTHDVKPWLDNTLLALGTLGGQGSSVSWVAVHRGYHHRFSDTPKDLHSPSNGIWSALVGWYWRMTPDTINHKYAVELLRRPNHVWVHKHYMHIMWTVMAATFFLPLGWLWWSALFLSLVQDNAVNLFCHLRWAGYRNFDTKDNSVNVPYLGFLGWGQGWHNNHHEHPSKFLFGVKWWEVDPCALFLPLLSLGSKAQR
jgi:fatty-acid desaturase